MGCTGLNTKSDENNSRFLKQINVNPFGNNNISVNAMKYINFQMENSVCKITCSDGKSTGTGFFCKIPFPDNYKFLPVLITNNHILNENDLTKDNRINFTLNNNKLSYSIFIDDSRKVDTSDKYDVTIIELREKDGIELNSFIELDDEIDILKGNIKTFYKNKEVYLLHYPKGGEIKLFPGKIKGVAEDNNYNFQHYCNTDFGSSGSPIINSFNYKVIGIHKAYIKKSKINSGTLLKEPIQQFIDKFIGSKEDTINSELTLIYDFSMDNINNNDSDLFEILTGEKLSKYKIFGDKLVENNKKI